MATKEIHMNKEGGYYYRALTWHWLFVFMALPFVFLAVVVCLLNPFWFRASLFNWVERRITDIAQWRDRIKYRIYLGTDPEVWHALKDR